MYRPAVAAMVADVVPPADRQRAYGYLYWAVNVGFAVAPAAAGLVAGRSYLLVFAVDAATMVGYGALVWARVPESRPAAGDAAAGDGGLGVVLRDRTYLTFAALAFLGAFVMWQGGVALPLDMKRKGLSVTTYGALLSLNGVLITFLQPALVRAIERRARSGVFLASGVLLGVGFGLHGLVATPAGYALAITIWTLGEIVGVPAASATVAAFAPPAQRGRYQGLYGAVWGLASLTAPLAGGFVLGRLGGGWLWGGCAALAILGGVGHVLHGPARERRAARAQR
jgi:MFS family permease